MDRTGATEEPLLIGWWAPGRHRAIGWVLSGHRSCRREQHPSRKDSAACSRGQAGATVERSGQYLLHLRDGGRYAPAVSLSSKVPSRGLEARGGGCGSGPSELRPVSLTNRSHVKRRRTFMGKAHGWHYDAMGLKLKPSQGRPIAREI